MPDSPAPTRAAAFFKKFTVLRSAPRELWIIYFAYILENIAYKLSSGQMLPLWLTHDLGLSDTNKGLTIGIWSALMTFVTVLVGSLTDVVGIRRTFLLGFAICIVARIGMLASVTPWVALSFGMCPLAVGLALMTPVMTAAMKRYSTAAQRSVAFSLYYALMNLGFAIGDRIFDYLRHVMGEYGNWILPVAGQSLSTYRVMIAWSVLFTVPGLVMTWLFLRDGVEMTEAGVRITPPVRAESAGLALVPSISRNCGMIAAGMRRALGKSCRRIYLRKLAGWTLLYALALWVTAQCFEQGDSLSNWKWLFLVGVLGVLVAACLLVILRDIAAHSSETGAATVKIFEGLWRQPEFHRFLIFMVLVVGVRMIFLHLNYTMPDFAVRELGKGAPFAQVSSMLNSLLILVLVPICGVLSQRISAYRMVSVGSLVSALSVCFLALPPELFRPLADGWLGDLIVHRWLEVAGPVNPLYIAIFLFTVALSIGEALWSPRLYEYAAAIAPKGQEASYMALSLLPYFFAKLGAGVLSGWLLATFCPAAGPRHPTLIWAIVGGFALITPIGTFFFRKSIQVHEDGREDEV